MKISSSFIKPKIHQGKKVSSSLISGERDFVTLSCEGFKTPDFLKLKSFIASQKTSPQKKDLNLHTDDKDVKELCLSFSGKNENVFRAIEFAADAHKGQTRKATGKPFLIHPLGVAKILSDAGCSDKLIIAGLLHDTVEDTPVTFKDIKENFGSEVASLVEGASEPDKGDTWENRKKHTIGAIKDASEDVLLVEIADKFYNVRSLGEDEERLGPELWTKFKRGKDKQRWYFNSLADEFGKRLKDEPGLSFYNQFRSEIDKVFGDKES